VKTKFLFFGALILVATGVLAPPLALAAGICFGMLCLHPFERQSRSWSKILLQVAVVALGFGIDFSEVLRVGKSSFVYTAISITCAMAIGLLLGHLLQVKSKASFLIAAGTAICGGSAIAALAPIMQPDEEELAMSLGTVFTLNSVALLLFPAIGFALHMTQPQFGLWSALAIHDTSSVVGAAAKFGTQALAIGTVVKLTRALWIIPVAILTAVAVGKQKTATAKVQIPWFILLFCLAALAKTARPSCAALFHRFTQLGHIGLALTLFLIGTGITLKTIRQAGARVMLQGVTLWIIVATASLALILNGVIHL
jgi:uncharacterized integral membrane protein (TIGR00698 family)